MNATASIIPLIIVSLLASRSAEAQEGAIERIRAEYATTEREASRYRRTEHEVYDFSLEGGVLHGFYRGSELRKLAARLYGESWQGSEEYYFADGELIFIHAVREVYDEPMSGRVAQRLEYRYYFHGGRLIRQVGPQRPAEAADYLSLFDPELPTLLENARLFSACAAAPAGPDRPECTAPAR